MPMAGRRASGLLWVNELPCSPSGQQAQLKSFAFWMRTAPVPAIVYFTLGPPRGMHFRDRITPVSVILVPDTSLICPAGQLPSSTLTRWPRRNSTMSCSRETVACVFAASTSNPTVARKKRVLAARPVANETSCSAVIWDSRCSQSPAAKSIETAAILKAHRVSRPKHTAIIIACRKRRGQSDEG
jgi:hypothetical protein